MCNTLWIISSRLNFGWQKIILTNWIRLVMSLFVVSLFWPNQLFIEPKLSLTARTQNAPVYIQKVSLLFPAKGKPTNKPITFWGAISLLKKLDIKIISSLAVSDTGTLNSDPFKFLTSTRQVLNTYQRLWPCV